MEFTLRLVPSSSVNTQDMQKENQAVPDIPSDAPLPPPVAPERWYSCDVFAQERPPPNTKAHTKTLLGGRSQRPIIVQYPENWEVWENSEAELGPSELCEKL